jgi:hypothetical protein
VGCSSAPDIRVHIDSEWDVDRLEYHVYVECLSFGRRPANCEVAPDLANRTYAAGEHFGLCLRGQYPFRPTDPALEVRCLTPEEAYQHIVDGVPLDHFPFRPPLPELAPMHLVPQ